MPDTESAMDSVVAEAQPVVEEEVPVVEVTLAEQLQSAVNALVNAMQSNKQSVSGVSDADTKVAMVESQLVAARQEKSNAMTIAVETRTNVGSKVDGLIEVLQNIKTEVSV